jgi:hypothetical protein
MTAEWGSVDLMMMNDGEGFHTIDNQQVRRTTTLLRNFSQKGDGRLSSSLVVLWCGRRFCVCDDSPMTSDKAETRPAVARRPYIF